MDRAFKGVWIEADIWLCKELKIMEKIFLVEISSLDNKKGCYASNAYFAGFFDLSKSRCSQIITSLKSKGLITVKLVRKNNVVTERIIKRTLMSVKSLHKEVKDKSNKVTDTSENELEYTENTYISGVKECNLDTLQQVFELYPSHRRGGSSWQLKKLWREEKLTESDAALFLGWLEIMQETSPEWKTNSNGKFIFGLIRFTKERLWRVPIQSKNQPVRNTFNDPHEKTKSVATSPYIENEFINALKKKFSVN